MGVLPGEMDWMHKEWCSKNPCKCAAGIKYGDVTIAIPDSEFCMSTPSKPTPIDSAIGQSPTKLRYGILFAALIAAGAYLILGGKKN